MLSTRIEQFRALADRAAVGKRLSALVGAARTVDAGGRLVATELLLLPLRPIVLVSSAVSGRGPGPIWRALTRPLGGQVRRYRLRDGGRPVAIRQGTPDVFSLYELLWQREYDPPPGAARAVNKLGPTPRVLDLGANIGLFGLFALTHWPHARVTSIEADPENMLLLEMNRTANGDADWMATCAFAAERSGEIPFASGHFAVSRSALGGTDLANVVVPTLDALALLSDCDFAKIDIEGGEWPILTDPRLAESTAEAIVLEFHPWGAPGDDPGEIASGHLRAAGYQVAITVENPDGTGIVWAWRP